ncbi:MFS transporter [Ideonella sp.]|uniref:MFS transporter n=1 Tax=Ideonella sp. TaxID=1929293 RepID=UPI0035B0CB9A
MYQFQLPARAKTAERATDRPFALPAIVYGIGVSSLLADVSAEMVVSVLPMYLFGVLQLSPLMVGFLDGIYQGGAALARIAAAMLSDGRFGARRVALSGYGLSALSRLLLASCTIPALMTGFLGAMAALVADRLGKGIRTAPRDALIAESVPREHLGLAFGVHRRLDAAGALLGPLLAAAILWWLPMRFEVVFLAAAAVSLPGMLVFWRATAARKHQPAVASAPGPGMWSLLRTPWFAQALLLVGATSLFAISDGLFYASIQRGVNLSPEYFPLLSVVSALGFLLAAAPLGRLADRVGALKVYLAGNACLAATYLVWACGGVTSTPVAMAMVLSIGVYYAATDGVIVAAVAAALAPELRTRGLALLATAIGGAKFLSSLLFGALWTHWSVTTATLVFAAGLVLSVAAAALRLRQADAPEMKPC